MRKRRRFETHIRRFEQKNGIRIDDEFRFFRNWMEKPLLDGRGDAVRQGARPHHGGLCRPASGTARSSNSDPARVRSPKRWWLSGIDPARLVLVEFDPTFCHLLRQRYPERDRGAGRCLFAAPPDSTQLMQQPAAAVVSGLPLFTKPLRDAAAAPL